MCAKSPLRGGNFLGVFGQSNDESAGVHEHLGELDGARTLTVVPLGVRSFIAFPEVYPFGHWEAMWILTAVATVLTILGATIIYLLVERPIMNLRK